VNKKTRFVYAYDDKIKREVLHIIDGNELVSTITGRRQKKEVGK